MEISDAQTTTVQIGIFYGANGRTPLIKTSKPRSPRDDKSHNFSRHLHNTHRRSTKQRFAEINYDERKSHDNAPLSRKKARLQRQVIHGDQITDTHALHSSYSPPLSLAGPERCKNRKRTPYSQSDTFQAPETKRARSSPCESLDPDSGR